MAEDVRVIDGVSDGESTLGNFEPTKLYYRIGEVSQLIKQVCLQNGVSEANIHLLDSPLTGVRYALERMQARDLGLFFILSERDEVIDYIKSR